MSRAGSVVRSGRGKSKAAAGREQGTSCDFGPRTRRAGVLGPAGWRGQEAETPQVRIQTLKRQTDDVRVTALDGFDEQRADSLQRVRARLVHAFARGGVPVDLFLGQPCER